MSEISSTENVPVVRTDFSDDEAWKALCSEMSAPVPFNEHVVFQANLSFIDENDFDGMKVADLVSKASGSPHPVLFVVDAEALKDEEHPVLCVDLMEEPGRSFRFVPSHSWGVENNLSLANMDFEEFQELCDSDGVFRKMPGAPGE